MKIEILSGNFSIHFTFVKMKLKINLAFLQNFQLRLHLNLVFSTTNVEIQAIGHTFLIR